MPQDVSNAETQPHLKRVLGQRDLVLLFVVAVFNLNVLPSIAANGGVTMWLWIISLVLFFWPQGIAVIELAQRYPGEGGVYLWAKEVFGDFHGFLSGWCYWTNNMMYVPTVLLYFVGVSVFALGAGHEQLADNKIFALTSCAALLAILVVLNIVGLGVGKWVNNIGGMGTFIAAGLLMGLGLIVWSRFGTNVTWADFKIPENPRFVLNSFGVICFGLVGLELASIMGDEIKDPQKTLPVAVAWGGILSGALYIGATLTLLVAVSKQDISVLQGIVQAVTHMAERVGVLWIVAPFAFLLSLSIAGIGSAWLGGSARIPFVAGLDSYMPRWLGSIHSKYRTPYAALLVHAGVSFGLVLMNFVGWWFWNKYISLPIVWSAIRSLGFDPLRLLTSETGVQETFQKLLSLAVVLQLIPFLYMFGALLKLALAVDFQQVRYSKTKLILAGASGLVTTALGIGLAFFPAQQITSLFSYEVWMWGGTLLFVGAAGFFFFVYGRRKTALKAAA
ncbi:MAG TPA: APC family permease [Candidatus Acidoferrum sp.]|nr:APC family permease [Candidatus Acidoferrum sp.]